MPKVRKNELMYELYGYSKETHACGDCCNFVSDRYHDKILRKCKRYGLTHSEASDWNKSYIACGKFNIPLPEGERPIISTVRGGRTADNEPIEGQLSL